MPKGEEVERQVKPRPFVKLKAQASAQPQTQAKGKAKGPNMVSLCTCWETIFPAESNDRIDA